MEPTLLVIGLNHRTASLAQRERFWLSESRRYEVLKQLRNAEGVEEVVILSTCCRTEFLIWASEPTLAANSLLSFLSADCGLRLTEWEHFYRLLEDAALLHICRVASGLDSLVLGDTHIATQLKAAWDQARTVDASGRFLNAVLEQALSVARHVHEITPLGKLPAAIPNATLRLARQIFGSIAGRSVLLLGTGKMSELCAREMAQNGATPVMVIDQSPAHTKEVAESLQGTPASLADRWKCMQQADIIISSTGCPHVVITAEEAERISAERNRVALVIFDIAMPRDVDPEVRRVDGILLYDLDSLERAVRDNNPDRVAAAAAAEKIVAAEALAFRSKLKAESVVPTIIALRRRFDDICRQELESFITERGPFTREQDQLLHAITAQVVQKIASSLARELKELPEKGEQERMTAVVTRLFHLDAPSRALAGTRSKQSPERNEKNNERNQAIASNF